MTRVGRASRPRPRVPAEVARALLLGGLGLLEDPARAGGDDEVLKVVEALGFVQLDSIQRIERAHHLIVGARLHAYRHGALDRLAFERRALFEHWTHDASLIPTAHYPRWKPRFAAARARIRDSGWFTARLGPTPRRTIARVLARIRSEGALGASDFPRAEGRAASGWWDWTPEKAALEFLWRTGVLAVARREAFQKRYDLAERVLPEPHAAKATGRRALVDWACSSALDRLGVATAAELSGFWGAIDRPAAGAWAKRAGLVEVEVEAADGTIAEAFAPVDWDRRAAALSSAPAELRLLAPFDPLVRDRARLSRRFGFDYRFEAFVPAAKRVHGYYVLPMLQGARLVGRLEARFDRPRGAIALELLRWEPGERAGRTRLAQVEAALLRIGARIGADRVEGLR